jgi:succinate dehydrogenase/fumarate reductase flavoprotein subunit
MTETFDITVIGAGTAGVPCAIEAAAAGARVLLLERSGRVGGTLSVSGAHISGAGTRRQQQRNVLGDTPRAHFEDIVRITGDTVRHDLLKRAVELAPGTVDWLDDHGFEFDDRSPFLMLGHEPYSVARTYSGKNGGHSVLKVYERLIEEQLRNGRLALRLNARVTELITSDQRVVGLAYESDGRNVVSSEYVVLACGGYVGNHALFEELHGRPLTSVGLGTSTGDALTLTAPLGVTPVNADSYLPTVGSLPDPECDGWAEWGVARPLLHTAFRQPWEIYVDRSGMRFVAEDHPSLLVKQQALSRIPDLTFFVILDEHALRTSDPVIADWDAQELRDKANSRRGVFAGGSLADVAGKAGIDRSGLEKVVESYNAAVKRSHDDEFGRHFRPAPLTEPPFYAIEIRGIALDTFAGVDVGSNLQVQSGTGPVGGLFAIGEAIGAAATTGRVVCGGMLVTPAISFGRDLGRRLALSCDT